MRPIITLEDGTEILETTGDVDAFEHGGGVLFRTPRRKDVYWQFWREREMGTKNYAVFTAPVPLNVIDFYQPDINELCEFGEIDRQAVRRLSRSKKPKDRLRIVMAICEVYGPSRVDPDHEPELMTPWDLAHRWGAVFERGVDEIPAIEADDYIVRESKFGDYESGCVDGTYFGRFRTYKEALCAVANHIEKVGSWDSNVMHEHAPGKLELVVWDPNEFMGKLKSRRGKLPVAGWKLAMKKYSDDERMKAAIRKRNSKRKSTMKRRRRQAQRLQQQERIERARAMRKAYEEIYR